MNLEPSADDLAFRDEVRRFLAARLTPDLRAASAANTGTFCELEATIAWHRALYDQGWIAPGWSVEHGGAGWTDNKRYIFAAECAQAGAPAPLTFGLAMCGPVLMRYGTAEQKAHYLPRILSGEDRWCQGYSEPGAGSDLASLQTRARLEGDHYVVTGAKVWTTFGHHATHCFCLVRTDSSGKPQNGITFLLIEMSTPGITVRPIVNIAGDHEFNEVRFDEVRVPVQNRVGEEGRGWTVAKALLEFERGGNYAAGLRARFEWVKRLASDGCLGDPGFRKRLAELDARLSAVEMLELRALSAVSQGEPPGFASSVLKLQGSDMTQLLDELAIEAMATTAPFEGSNAAVAMGRYLYDRSVTIFGGTSEIQRNILARAALGL